jgi:hypothetical protein
MIATEERDDRPRVAVVKCQGSRIGADVTEQGNHINQWVRKEKKPPLWFDPQKERDTYKKSRKDMIEIEWGASTLIAPPVSNMPPTYDHVIIEGPIDKESTWKICLKSFLKPIKD